MIGEKIVGMSFHPKPAGRGGNPPKEVCAHTHTTAHTWAAPPSVSARRPMTDELHCACTPAISTRIRRSTRAPSLHATRGSSTSLFL